MISPIIGKVKAFDATKEKKIYFEFPNKHIRSSIIKIYEYDKDNLTYNFIKNHEYKSLTNVHIVEPNVFANNKQYKIELIITYTDDDNIEHQTDITSSAVAYFVCTYTPLVSITNFYNIKDNIAAPKILDINIHNTCDTSSNNIESFKVCVFTDKNLTQLYTETPVYTKPITPGSSVSVKLNNLGYSKTNSNITRYYIQVQGVSSYGQNVNSVVYPVVIGYCDTLISPFQAEINNGHVNLRLGNINTEGRFESGSLSSVSNDGVNVINGDSLIYNLILNDDFSIYLKHKYGIIVNDKTPMLELIGDKGSIQIIGEFSNKNIEDLSDVKVNATTTENIRFVLISSDTSNIVFNYSNTLTKPLIKIDDSNFKIATSIAFRIKRKNGYYSISIE